MVKTGLLAGALYGAELNLYTKGELTFMNMAVFGSEGMDVARVPNYIKESVLGTDVSLVFKVAVAPIKIFAREMWLRTDKTTQASKGFEGLLPNRLLTCGTMYAMTMKNVEEVKTTLSPYYEKVWISLADRCPIPSS